MEKGNWKHTSQYTPGRISNGLAVYGKKGEKKRKGKKGTVTREKNDNQRVGKNVTKK